MNFLIKTLDKYTGGIFYKIYKILQYFTLHYNVIRNKQHHIICNYDRSCKSALANLCDLYGSDKGSAGKMAAAYTWKPHTYTDFYELLFGHCRSHVKKVFECGIGTNQPDLPSSMTATGKPGASLRVWRDYFPEAIIVGADIDRSILFNEDRIKTGYLDQTNPATINSFWKDLGLTSFDFMVDDGLHTFESSITLFKKSINHLAQFGVYIIEDVSLSDLKRYKLFFGTQQQYQVKYLSLLRTGQKLANNNLVMIKFVD